MGNVAGREPRFDLAVCGATELAYARRGAGIRAKHGRDIAPAEDCLEAVPRAWKVRSPMLIDKAEIMAVLLSRGHDSRAAWVDRQLPELVETYANESLLRLLDIDLSTMTPVEQP
jgi:hypothetical protein